MQDAKTLNTEGPATGQSYAAGGVDLARDAARAEQAPVTPEPTPATQDAPSAPTEPVAAPEGQTDGVVQGAQTPTAAEQAEIDEMVDYVVKEGDSFPPLPDGTQVQAGMTIKLSKDHELLKN